MRSFSLRGMATKGFYGPNAQGLGYPAGGGAGNSSGSPTPAFTPVDGGVFPADPVVWLAQLDAAHLAVVTQNGNAGHSSNGGTTWTQVPGPLGLITTAAAVFSNAAGTALVAFGVAGAARKLSHSADGGATWTDVTPSATLGANLTYSPTANLFIIFDTTAVVWTSPDGVTWTSTATPVIFFQPGNVPGIPLFGDSGLNLVTQASDATTGDFIIGHSTDGKNWVVVLDVPQTSGQAGGINWTGSQFVTVATPSGVQTVWTSNAAGTVWTVQSTSADPNTPPYGADIPVFKGNYYNGFSQVDFTSIAVSPDAITWTRINLSFAGFSAAALLSTLDILYNYGAGILGSTDGMTFTVLLTLAFPDLINDMENGPAGVFAVGSNGGNGAIWRLV